jgi:hypothetical protein
MNGVIAKVGRPVALNDRVIDILDAAIRRGLSVTEACMLAGIHRSTYYEHLANNEVFAYRMELARCWLGIIANCVVFNSIVIDNNLSTSKWYLSHRDPEFGARVRCRYCASPLRSEINYK